MRSVIATFSFRNAISKRMVDFWRMQEALGENDFRIKSTSIVGRVAETYTKGIPTLSLAELKTVPCYY